MSFYDDEPELAGYEPHNRPLRSHRVVVMMRVVVVLALVALVVPGILVTWGVAASTASNTCASNSAYYKPDSIAGRAAFEIMGPGGFGWQCYWIDGSEGAHFLMPLGIIPAAPVLPGTPLRQI
ncbi:hypothetical protein [Compostimonas suwonensis]|uniref:Uncharacterized protein n=1 Tax=Compostimonas suwonensis TaxID=1048394 RepID=A0A2M9BW35_9MICO|nr:hypothetical protein [Compostimonas suwonensis]PJJ62150.1 hypothetical protein CLV54_1946 [Compostimonas suwonensis]